MFGDRSIRPLREFFVEDVELHVEEIFLPLALNESSIIFVGIFLQPNLFQTGGKTNSSQSIEIFFALPIHDGELTQFIFIQFDVTNQTIAFVVVVAIDQEQKEATNRRSEENKRRLHSFLISYRCGQCIRLRVVWWKRIVK